MAAQGGGRPRPTGALERLALAARPAPHRRGARSVEARRPAQPAQAAGPDPVRRRQPAPGLLRQVPLQPEPDQRHHHRPLPRPGRAPARQRLDRAGEGQPLGGHGPPAPVRLPGRGARHGSGRNKIAEIEATDPDRAKVLARRPALLRPAEEPGPAHPAGRQRPGLPRPRRDPAQQRRADQGRRAGHDDDRVGAPDGGDRRPGPGRPEAGARPDHRPQHDDRRPDRIDVRAAPPAVGRDQRAGGLGDDRPGQAPDGVPEHLRHDGRDRHLQGQGAGQHGEDDQRPVDRDRQVPVVCQSGPRTGRAKRGLRPSGRKSVSADPSTAKPAWQSATAV